jgi:type I site-specific restriction-modification system R (restriction) subunit
MRSHGLMQAIARVNRVFKDKPGGLVVDYLGLADELRQALAVYTESGGLGETAIDQAEAVAEASVGVIEKELREQAVVTIVKRQNETR